MRVAVRRRRRGAAAARTRNPAAQRTKALRALHRARDLRKGSKDQREVKPRGGGGGGRQSAPGAGWSAGLRACGRNPPVPPDHRAQEPARHRARGGAGRPAVAPRPSPPHRPVGSPAQAAGRLPGSLSRQAVSGTPDQPLALTLFRPPPPVLDGAPFAAAKGAGPWDSPRRGAPPVPTAAPHLSPCPVPVPVLAWTDREQSAAVRPLARSFSFFREDFGAFAASSSRISSDLLGLGLLPRAVSCAVILPRPKSQ